MIFIIPINSIVTHVLCKNVTSFLTYPWNKHITKKKETKEEELILLLHPK